MIEDADWQKIGYGTYRLRVPGGWFVTLYTGGPAKTAFFYPDAAHEWDGGALKGPIAAADSYVPTVSTTELVEVKAKVEEPAETPASDGRSTINLSA